MLQELTKKLHNGFFVRNLYEMASICSALAKDAGDPVPFYVLRSVFRDIARDWDDRPLEVEEARSVESALSPSVRDLLAALAAGRDQVDVDKLLTRLVSVHLTVLAG